MGCRTGLPGGTKGWPHGEEQTSLHSLLDFTVPTRSAQRGRSSASRPELPATRAPYARRRFLGRVLLADYGLRCPNSALTCQAGPIYAARRTAVDN